MTPWRELTLVMLSTGILSSLLFACRADEPTEARPSPEIIYPLDGTIFPPEIAPPTFRWKSASKRVVAFLITVGDEGSPKVAARVHDTRWTPNDSQWGEIKALSKDRSTKLTIRELYRNESIESSPSASVEISTSSDKVGAPIFFREVNLPFIDAIKDPTLIRWRFGSISSREPPPVILEKLPVCGNCHSFSADGSVVGMDVDYGNDKGSYFISEVSEQILLDRESIITWADYRREDGQPTFGLLSQVSPSGRYVASTVKDRSVFVPMPDLDFSQLFFPIKGIIAVYDRQEKTFAALPGADDVRFVQSNPTWSPDGEHLIFAKNKAHPLKNVGNTVLLSREDAAEFIEGGKQFRFDLYRVPFNNGKGGRPEPLEGASNNGMSNFFPRYSPDGRWIVFTKAKSFMLLQPDSELYIMPAAGGVPRKMRCNTARMNSWHSWSPNGRWLVFSAKPDDAYTQMYLTHIDDEGVSSPPVLLDRMVAPKRAVNIPEFVAADPAAIKRMHEHFVDEISFMRAGNEALKVDAPFEAELAYRRALKINPDHTYTLNNLGYILMRTDRREEARELFERAVKLEPDAIEANNNLGALLLLLRDYQAGKSYLTKYLEHRPEDHAAFSNLGYALERLGELDQAQDCYEKSLKLRPEHTPAHCNLGSLLKSRGDTKAARAHLEKCAADSEATPHKGIN